MDLQSKAHNPALKTQVEAQVEHLQADLTGLKDRVARIKQLATGYVHETEEAATAAKSAVNAAALHVEAVEEKITEFLRHIV